MYLEKTEQTSKQMTALEEPKLHTFEEYLHLEQETQTRYEFFEGEVFAMARGTKRHNTIAKNISFQIDTQKPDCQTYLNDVKLEFQAQNYYVYPDVMLTCDSEDLQDDQESIIRKPVLVVEVLSPSTAEYDANKKKRRYFRLESLQYYLLISQEKPIIEIYERQSNFWKYILYEDLEDSIILEKLAIELQLKDIYKAVKFSEETQNVSDTESNP